MAIIETIRKIAKYKDAIPPEKVGTPGRIGAILQALVEQRRGLEVAIDERMQIFSSSGILKIGTYDDKPCLVIDTLIPKIEGIRALEGSARLEIGFRLNDVPHTFMSTFHALSRESSPTVTIAYPDAIYVHQFRGAYRLSPTTSEPIVAHVQARPAVKKEGQDEQPAAGGGEEKAKETLEEANPVDDISIEGMAFFTKNRFPNGTEVFVEFEVPGQGVFKTKAVVMNLSRVESTRYPYKCGIRFEGLPAPEKEKIYRYILGKQREEIKRRQSFL